MNTITQSYTGADATGEILVMLTVAFALGYLLRWAWEKFLYAGIYEVLADHKDTHATQEGVASEGDTHIQHNTNTTNTTITENIVAVAPQVQAPIMMPYKQDDLKVVEGIGPKIESLLQDSGIHTWEDLSLTEVSRLREILNNAGERYRIHDPSTWPEQSRLAFEHNWTELEEYQNFLSGGKMIG